MAKSSQGKNKTEWRNIAEFSWCCLSLAALADNGSCTSNNLCNICFLCWKALQSRYYSLWGIIYVSEAPTLPTLPADCTPKIIFKSVKKDFLIYKNRGIHWTTIGETDSFKAAIIAWSCHKIPHHWEGGARTDGKRKQSLKRLFISRLFKPIQEKDFHQEGGQALEQGREVVTALSLMEFKKHLDNTLRHMVWFLGGPLGTQELDFMIFTGPFQLGYSMILWILVRIFLLTVTE